MAQSHTHLKHSHEPSVRVHADSKEKTVSRPISPSKVDDENADSMALHALSQYWAWRMPT